MPLWRCKNNAKESSVVPWFLLRHSVTSLLRRLYLEDVCMRCLTITNNKVARYLLLKYKILHYFA